MGRKLLFGLCFLLFAGLVNAGEWVPLTSHDPAPARIEVVSSSLEETILSVSIPGYFREEVELDGTKYEIFSLSSGHNLMEKGCPTLPFEATDVAVANQGTVSYSVGKGKSVTLTVENYLPSKGHFTRNIDPETVPYTFAKVYDTDADYPRSIVQVGEPFILRNVRGVNVSIRPFQYNPIQAKMTITTDFQFSIRTVGRSDKNVLTDDQIVPESKLYQDIYRTRFINYEQNAQRYTAIGEIGNMLIITNDSFYNDMLPLLYWKLQKGIPCKMVTLTTTGSTAANVQAYIQNEYATNGLTFVLLVGDSAEMPSLLGSEESVKSDPTYAFISGSDSYPELFISRFPAQTPTDVQIMVNRIINYEKTPMSGSSGAWYHQAFGIGGDDEGSTGIADWERVDLLKDEMVTPAYNYTVFTEIYHSSATASQVTAAVNNGRGIGVYIGHGSQISWGTTGFDVTDTYALTNTDLVPLVHSVACLVGQFYYSGGDCFAEAWQKCGTPAAPTGAVAHYGSVTNQSWVPPCDAQTETIDLLVSDSFHSIGALCFNGTMGGMDLWPGSEGNTLMQQWHIFGDCSTMIYTDELATLSVSHAGAMPVGQATYDVTVTGVEDALCALYNASTHVLYGSNYTNSSGQTTITLDPVPASVMELTLTVTGFNKMPYFDTVDVIVPSGPWLVHDSHIIDDSTGNDDGIINPGETVNMPVTLENIGADPATGVSATLTTSNTDVTVTDNYATYPDIAVSGTGQSLANHYSFTVSSSAGEGDAIPFSLNWSASGGYADVTGFTEYVCEILTISNISITDVTINSAIIHWTTNIPADSLVTYGTTTPPSMQQSNSTLTTSHSITLTGLTDCTTYYFEVSSTSPNCYILTDDNGGAYYNFTTYMQQVSFFDDMESGTGSWISSGLWHQVTEPTCSPSAYSSSTSWYYGQDSSCNFSTGSTTTGRLYSEAIEIVAGTELHFWYRRDTECGGCCTYDNTSVQISTNGGSSWTTLEEVCDDSDEWVEYAGYDLSTYAGQTINLGFYFDSYDSTANTYTGWMIDDVTISKPAPCVPLAEYSSHIFTDDCPAGGAGDADGILDAGETIVFQIDIANTGSGDLTGVWAELSTSTTGVTVTDAQANYNNIAEGTSGTSLSPHFTVYLAETIACGTTLDFSLTIHTNEGNFTGGSFSETVGEIVPGNFTLIDEDFESAWGTYGDNPPTGWTIEDYGDEGTPTWNANDWYRYSKGGAYSYIARVYYSPLENQDEWLITPAFTIPVGATSVNLEYDHYFRMYSTGEYGYVDFRSTQNPSWTNLVTYSSTTSDMAHVTISLLAYAGNTNCQVRFRYVAYNGWNWDLDNVLVSGVQTGACNMTVCTGGCSMTVAVTPNGTTTVCTGNNIVFTATPSGGTSPYSYQWTEDGSDIGGATNATLTRNYATAQSHSYNCKISDAGACVDITDGTASIGTWELTPGAPVISSVTDLNACALTGVSITFTAGSGAASHNLWVDGSQAVTGITSPYTYVPGNSSSHSYVVRAINGSCYANSNAVAGTDVNDGVTTVPVITSIVDNDPLVQDGIFINFNAGSPATSHNLYRDSSLVVTGYVSGVLYNPGDTNSHNYVVRAINGSCYADSTAVAATDEESTIVPPEITPIGWSGTETISWAEEATATNGYVLYRGVLDDLPDLLTSTTDFCIRWTGASSSDTSATVLTETATVGDCYYYLVVGVNGAGQGSAGSATAGERQVNDTGVCP